MIYDTNWSPDFTMNNSTGIREWWDAEHIPYNLAFDNTTFNQVKIFASKCKVLEKLVKKHHKLTLIINDFIR